MKTLALIKALNSFNEWRLLKHDNQPDPLQVTEMIERASYRLAEQHLLLDRCYDLLCHGGSDRAKEKLLAFLVESLK